MKKIVCFTLIAIVFLCSGCSRFVFLPKTDDTLEPTYTEACDAIKDGNYDKAYELFAQLGDYKDCKTHLSYFAYLPTQIISEDDGMGENIVTYRTEYQYNDNGKLISGKGCYTNNEGPGYSEKHTYNDAGQLIKSETESEAGFSTYTFEYNDDGNLIRGIGCTDGADVGSITLHTYDENGRCIKAEMSSYMGINVADYVNQTPYHTDTYVYTYDAQSNCIKLVNDFGDGQITYSAEYNENGLPTVIKSDDNNSFVSETVFEYDDSGRCTKIVSPYDTTVFSYNDDKLPVSAIRTRDGGKPCNITYEYKLFYLKDGAPKTPFFMEEHLSLFNV